MVIYKSIVKKIIHELKNREEVMAKLNLTPDMYYAYMVGRMEPILEAILNAEEIKD